MLTRRGIVVLFAFGVIAFGVASSVMAEEGAAKDKVIAALTATAAGNCPEDIMGSMLLDACEDQLPANSRMLSGLGKIKGATFKGMRDFPSGKAESYKVEFEHGTQRWYASLGPDGKLLTLFATAGPTHD